MTLHVTTQRFIDYVQVDVSGPATMKGYVELVQQMEQETMSWADAKVMVDLRKVEGRLDAAEQVFLGELVAQYLRHLEKVASVVRAEDLTGNSEAAAQMLGMRLRVFTDPAQAAAWLKAPTVAVAKPAASARPIGLPSDSP